MKIMDMVNPAHPMAQPAVFLPGAREVRSLSPEDVPADVRYVCAVDEAGKPVGTVAAERLRAVLRGLNSISLETVLDELADGVILVDRTGVILYVNPAYSQILGVPAGKILGKDLHSVEKTASLLEVLDTGRPIARETKLVQTARRYVSIRAFPLFDRGKLVGAASVFRDTTEVNRLNMELERASQMAAEYNRQLEANAILRQNNIIGESRRFVDSVVKATAVAATDATVLLRGENGTGKEIFTRLIHQNSGRKDQPFVSMNCAAIPESLFESELFGYEEGAFTGAKKGGQLGKFQLAENGTLFLDEIGDMPLSMQAKLLRVLQEGEIEKIGRQGTVAVNVRLIAATNQPLEQMIEEGRFRQDLFYRLNVVPIEIPPLRDRERDVVLLANHYIEEYNAKYKKRVRLSEEVYQLFLKYSWPGNVRELQNIIESCVVLCDRGVILAADLPETITAPAAGKGAAATAAREQRPTMRLDEAVTACERAAILDALEKSGYVRGKAIALLGISRRTFYRKVEELQIPLP